MKVELYKENKGFRLLHIYELLKRGEIVTKKRLSQEYGVSEKTIQRDIEDLRVYLIEHDVNREDVIIYNRRERGYSLVQSNRTSLIDKEALAVCKILLESRAFCKDELQKLLKKLILQVSPHERKKIEDMIKNEEYYYVPLRHNKRLLNILWDLSDYILSSTTIEISYVRKDGELKKHLVDPCSIMFSEYYFYLIAFMTQKPKEYPTIFRIDRIQRVVATKTRFEIPYTSRFLEGEFRKRVQFMYAGQLKKVSFLYTGPSLESVLDRLPTAEVLSEGKEGYKIKVEVYGNGIEMWLRSQGDYVRVLEGL